MSGVTVLRRDQVLITLRSPAAFIASTFSRRWSSMNGPFFKLRGIRWLLRYAPCARVRESSLRSSARPHYLRAPRVRRRRMMSLSLVLPFLRVRPSGLPHGDTGWRPPELLPSPPPSGWSTGFIATPRTDGRLPFHRLRPALPRLMLPCSALPTSPTVARQVTSTRRISPDG